MAAIYLPSVSATNMVGGDNRDYQRSEWSRKDERDAGADNAGGRLPRVRGWVLRDDDYLLRGDEATWRAVERWLCERHGWEDVDEASHDAVTDEGERVEIKSCVWRDQAGEPGRIKIWEQQAVEADKVAVVVYVACSPPAVVAHSVFDAVELPREPEWVDHPTMGRSCRHSLAWPAVLGLGDVRAGLRHAFLSMFDDTDGVTVLDPPEYD